VAIVEPARRRPHPAARRPALRAAERPNIVFFFTDDQTSSTLGCYGHPIVQTPNIDALAARGVRFQNAFVSQSICWVSRTSILTGLTGRSYGTPDNPEQTRADAARTFTPTCCASTAIAPAFSASGTPRCRRATSRPITSMNSKTSSAIRSYKKQPDGSLRHETDLIVDRGIEFVKQQPKDKPFALNLWFNACHAEDGDRRPGIGHFAWPQSADGMYDDVEMPAAATQRSGHL
jgi:choline-sulfatase